ncbi:SpaA isopeptide-forming pilin-related protein [Neobacillus sp.]|uniref:SpaA isopeptide-forming pilin-related protein n=1 Tax=Neobacillus sp. TaxID=2675273 RepID=UPI00289EE297|nr:SpaA isopeptide-forming pilin-related protein [Neobacillus sp.]
MKSKIRIIAILFMFIVQTMFNGLGYPLVATAQESESTEATAIAATASEIKENILTSVVLKDKDGNVIHAAENPDLHPSLGSAVEISYTWALKNNHGYKAGDYFSFYLPKEFAIYNDIDAQPLLFGGSTVGTFTVTKDGKVTMTFNEKIETLSNVNGVIKLWTEFSEKLVGSVTKEIVFPIKDDQIVKIPVVFQPKQGPAIDKKGLPNRVYNAETINWTVDFNKQLAKVDQAILRDPIQTGQALQSGSIKLYLLYVQLDGSVKQGEAVNPNDYIIEKITGGGDFQIRFKEGTVRSAYRVCYTTTITNADQTSFENEASLLGTNISESKAKTTVTVSRGTPLAKDSTGYNAKEQTIEWTIKYNYNEKTIAKNNAVLTDYFNNSQKLVNSSFKVYKITLNENGTEKDAQLLTADKYTVTPISKTGQDGFEFKFLEEINAAYKIVYQTKAKDRIFTNGTITNSVVSGDANASASRNISQGILTKVNKPNYPDTNYIDKTTKWEITFNYDEFYMNKAKLTDIFPNKGLTLVPETLKIEQDVQGKREVLKQGIDYVLTQNKQDEFILTFLKPITETHFISYQTKFDYEARAITNNKYLDNKATLVWEDEAGKQQTQEATARFTPDTYTQNNGFKNGSYNAVTKEITWNIGVNYNLKTLSNPMMDDYILQGQELVEGSLKVYRMDLTGTNNGTKNGTELILGTDYTVTSIKDKDGNPGFRITFKKEINSPHFITYKTSLKDKLIKKTYNNTATLFDGTTEVTKLNASVSVQYGEEYTRKTGTQDNKLINWTVNINFGQSHVSNAKILDTPTPNQILLEDSFHLYATKVAGNGTVTKDQAAELKRDVDYKLTIKTDDQGSQSFEVRFLRTIDSAYILDYQSFINARNGDTVSNTVKFEGEQITTEVTESTQKVVVKLSGGSGTGSGETGSLEVTKVDATTGDVLQGATFTLYDSEGKIALRTLTTGEDGKVTFANLLYNDYILKEAAAPVGYLVGISDSQKVTVNAKDTKVSIKNKKIIRAVELTKVDSDNQTETLKGAKFALLVKEGNQFKKIAELETDDHGIIYKDQLEPGEYQFIEIEAPFGYKLDATPQSFTIGEKQTEKITITMKNQLSTGAVELVKIDKDHKETTLSGAVFKLQDAKGNSLRTGLTTDASGKLVVNNLKPGDYQFVETKAPFGYELDQTPIKFTIVKGQVVVAQVTAINELTTGSVELTKFDKDNQNLTLSGAVFELQDVAGKSLQTGLVTTEDGKLVVNNLKPGDYQFVETKAPFGYDLDKTPIKFTIVKGQTVVAKVTAINELTPGSVELIKIDKDHKELTVSGAEFALQDAKGKTLQSGLVTDVDGKLIVNHLKPGDYQLVEMKAPFGYELDQTPVKFTIVKGQTKAIQVTAINELTTGSVELTKVDKDDHKITLSGAEFELQDAFGKTLQAGLTTNEVGKLVVNKLKPGNYQFVETKAPVDYQLNATPIKFTIEKGQKVVAQVTAINELITGSVELTKVDKDNKELTLFGAEFELQDVAGKTLQPGLITGVNGKLVVNNLKPGNYQLVETKAPFGYNLDQTPIKFTIERSQAVVAQVTAINELTPGSVELTKVDKDNHELTLSGVEFELQDATGKTLQSGLVTNKEGKLVVNNLKPGNYQFVETKAPFGYDLDQTPIKFTIEKGQTVVAKITAINELTTGSVELTKIDKDNNDLTLSGAEFELQDAAGKSLQTGLVTDENGKLVVNNLKPGDYQFVETKAPFGYELDTNPIKFTIEKGQKVVATVTAKNVKKIVVTKDTSDPHKLANTATNIYNMMLVGSGLLLAGMVLLIIGRRKKSSE